MVFSVVPFGYSSVMHFPEFQYFGAIKMRRRITWIPKTVHQVV